MKNTRILLLFLATFFIVSCSGNITIGTVYEVQGIPLSINNQQFKNCIFNPHKRIVHYPMEHAPANGRYTQPEYELIVRSQFQLFHTIIKYAGRVAVFEESVNDDYYNEHTFSLLKSEQRNSLSATIIKPNGSTYKVRDLYVNAWRFFGRSIPQFYEHLDNAQKDYLFVHGASLLAYFLGIVPKLHKSISPQDYKSIKDKVFDRGGNLLPTGNYYIFDYRERALTNEVIRYYNTPEGRSKIALIAYGSAHNFNDDFAAFPFFERTSHCLNWKNQAF